MPQPPYVLLFEEVVSGAGLIRALESVRDEVDYVAINPPPAGEDLMKVRMGGLEELVDALQQSQEDDLFGLGGVTGLRLEPVEVLLAELGHLRRNDDLAVRLEPVVAEVILVVFLGDVEFV